MDHFAYRDRVLHCEDVPVPEIAEAYGTPVFVYSTATLLHHLNAIQSAFAAAKPIIAYSVKTNGNLSIRGVSLPSDVHEFYGPLSKWVDGLSAQMPPSINLTLQFEYFNTSSSISLHGLLKKLLAYSRQGTPLRIIWKHEADDSDMEDEGQLFQSRLNYPFEFETT